MVCVGIDVAKDKPDCFIISSEGEVLWDVFTIPTNMEGFRCLLERIHACTFCTVLDFSTRSMREILSYGSVHVPIHRSGPTNLFAYSYSYFTTDWFSLHPFLCGVALKVDGMDRSTWIIAATISYTVLHGGANLVPPFFAVTSITVFCSGCLLLSAQIDKTVQRTV